MRKRLEADLQTVERGEDPSGIVRDPAATGASGGRRRRSRIYVEPVAREQVVQHSAFLHALLPDMAPEDNFFLMAGQPDHVRAECAYLRGLSDIRPTTLDRDVALPSTTEPVEALKPES